MSSVIVLQDAATQMGELPKSMKGRMLELIVRLSRWPNVSGAKPLTGALAGQFRLRSGDYRMQFEVSGSDIRVVRVGHRDGFYDEVD